MHIGIIGLGAVGKKRFELFRDIPEVSNISFFDPTIKLFDSTRSVQTVETLFSDKNIDAIVICTPNAPKKGLIKKAFESRKHIFCEKPPGISHADALNVELLHRANPDIKIKFGFNHRYLSHYRSLKKTVNCGEYGKPLWVRGIYGKGFDESFFQGWRADKTLSGGGIFLDQGIHMLDLVLDLLGDLQVENVLIDNFENRPEIEMNAFINLRSHQGVPVSLHSSMVQWQHKLSLEVGTEQAIVGMGGVMSSTKSYGNEIIRIDRHWNNNMVESQINQYANPDYYSFQEECIDFINSIINDVPITIGTVGDALRIMELVDNIYSYN